MSRDTRQRIKQLLDINLFWRWMTAQTIRRTFKPGYKDSYPVAVYLKQKLRRQLVWLLYEPEYDAPDRTLWIMVREFQHESYYEPPQWVVEFAAAFDQLPEKEDGYSASFIKTWYYAMTQAAASK